MEKAWSLGHRRNSLDWNLLFLVFALARIGCGSYPARISGSRTGLLIQPLIQGFCYLMQFWISFFSSLFCFVTGDIPILLGILIPFYCLFFFHFFLFSLFGDFCWQFLAFNCQGSTINHGTASLQLWYSWRT
ncbi:hypothetical protein BGZ63DRAFT_274004 [Mariannaea sp. PMI_226]|nr:hypothetical protein BGZ63DRAFT_274004 [Mariannaea sp. PMI_226]